MLVCCVAAGTACLGLIFFAYLQNQEAIEAHLIVGAGHLVLCSTFLLLRRFPTMRIPSAAAAVAMEFQLINTAFLVGGTDSTSLIVFPVATVFLGLICGVAQTLCFAVVLCLATGVLFFLEVNELYVASTVATPEVMCATVIWAVMTSAGIAVYTRSQTDSLLQQAAEEVSARRAAQEDAEQANQAKDMFMAYMSHEIRNPLAVIMGSVDLMSRSQVEERRTRHIDAVRVASHGLVHLLDDVIDFASLKRNQIEVLSESVDMVSLLQHIVDLLTIQAERKGLELVFRHSTNARVLGDRARLGQVMTNLVGNAVKYTQEGRIVVEMDESAGRIRVCVTDSGPGIDPERRTQIFQPFERAQSGDIPGSGLGLAVSRELLHRMNSELLLVSPDSGGCAFHFWLPVDQESLVAVNTANVRPNSVLIVDDNEAACDLMAGMVRELGCTVSIAYDGPGALGQMQSSCPDVVLLDVDMPDMNGRVVAEKVRDSWGDHAPRIWFVTGNPFVSPSGLGEGVLKKPVTPAELERALSL